MSTKTDGLREKLEQRSVATVGAPKAPTLLDLLERQKIAIQRALPNTGMTAERFTRIVLTTVKSTPKLLECEPMSLIAAVMLSAQLGLEPGPLGHAYLVPFRNHKTGRTEVQFIIGYKGYIALARRSGTIVSIAAREVCAGDYFEFEYGLEEVLVHRPALTDRGPVIAYYGVAHFRDGGHSILVMSTEDVERYRKRSRASGDGPWVTDYDAMARKTVIRRMATFLPLSTDVARAIAADEATAPLAIEPDLVDAMDVSASERVAATEEPGVGSDQGDGSAPA